MNEIPHPGFDKPEDYETFTLTNGLEEAAEKEYPCDKSWMTPDMLNLNAHKQVAFRKGAKWQKEQMMKEAVDAKIYGYDDGSYELIASWLDLPKRIYKDGDKVRIIIVKEEV